ncbi:hypothetical protein [Auraticoccus cholistanensis]|uniref:hypothetical protein n=1 Tax=Auraticoccus cholistanensis TaxID=2656650 RepID=UPI0012E79996|nr:hypothetical protein [Auraticoccus cholistanensis]
MTTPQDDLPALDDGLLGFGAPPPDPRGESMADVMARVAEVAADLCGDLGPAGAATPFDDLSASATSPVGEVDVAVRDTVVTGLRLDEQWLRTADVVEVEQLVRDTVNRALADFRDRAVEQMLSGGSGGTDLASRIAALQTDMHEAFRNDLARAVAPGEELVRRMGGAS